MLEKYLIGMAGITALMAGWIGVQGLWRKAFSEHLKDEDVLAGRSNCGSCGCTTPCDIKKIQKTK